MQRFAYRSNFAIFIVNRYRRVKYECFMENKNTRSFSTGNLKKMTFSLVKTLLVLIKKA